MKSLVKVAIVAITLMPIAQATTEKVIYGDDNRVLVENSNSFYQKLAQSTAAQIYNKNLTKIKDGSTYEVTSENLEVGFANVCADEDFSQMITPAMCSGFLVGEDLLVTAGHCIASQEACDNGKWVFNFDQNVISATGNIIDAKNVFSCKKIINQKLDVYSKNDFALIQLDRKVEGREPLKFRKKGKVAMGDDLVLIGHPSGLPTIVADGAYVRENKNDFYFEANTDSFGGNSGSAVFNATTGEVEGILVRGEKDYEYDEEAGCNRPKKCDNNACRGEDITRITVIPELAPGMTPKKPEATASQKFQVWIMGATNEDLVNLWLLTQTPSQLNQMMSDNTLGATFTAWAENITGEQLFALWYQLVYSAE